DGEGNSLWRDARRLRALLSDLCPNDNRREINLLIAAVEENIPTDLTNSSQSSPKDMLLDRLAKRLEEDRGVTSEAARWAVGTWALALGVISPSDSAKFHHPVEAKIERSFPPAPQPGSVQQSGSPWPMFHGDAQRTGRGIGRGAVGRLKWRFETGDRVCSSPAIGADGTIYVGSWDYNLYALDGRAGQLKWRFKTGNRVYSSPAVGADGTIYVGSWDYNLYALDGRAGQLKWKYPTGNWVYSSSAAIGADGTVYVGSWDHNLYAIK
ncbi:MAG: PQQ-binding-like beta-propeller repeat protein, partial [Armatimonadetes bacterium]|nr:PQQ-binding-like beta-propeller repeat protein [Armatimonadota bacterium]